MTKKWRPSKWPKNQCDVCLKKSEDEYGLYCDLWCGKGTYYSNFEEGADAMLQSEEVQTALEYYRLMKTPCNEKWEQTLKEIYKE